MFSLFKKDTTPSFPTRDKIWKTGDEARKGLFMMAMMRLQKQEPALIFTFFEEEMQQFISFMDENKISYRLLDESIGTENIATLIYVTDPVGIQSTGVTSWLRKNANRLGKIAFFHSHHPLISAEDQVLSRLYDSGLVEFIFCLSFDDPMMAPFSKNIVPLMERLGLDDNESIEHPMVTSSIKNIRKKINEKVKIEKKARSAAEWYALNVKP